jgi:mannose-1-phosphate guanylyltransferase
MDRLWGIVLAAGNGRRVESFIQKIGGGSCPKQFYAFTGRRTMVQHTIDRVERLVPRNRIISVVGMNHTAEVQEQLRDRPAGTVIFQPENRDTLPGILLPLVHVLDRDPESTVAVFPSDHFIWDEARFMEYVRFAARVTDLFPKRVVLLGVKPDSPELDYGWIKPGQVVVEENGHVSRKVCSFHEKPRPDRAMSFFNGGHLWNTLVFVGKAITLYEMAREFAPRMVSYFDLLSFNLGRSKEQDVLRGMYARMESMNISSDLFQKAADRLMVLPVQNVGWNDWGREERIVETLDRYGLSLRTTVPHRQSGAYAPAGFTRQMNYATGSL